MRSRFSCVIPVVETSSEGVIYNSVKRQRWSSSTKTANSQTVDCFRKKAPPQTSDQIPNADLTGSAVNVGSGWAASA